MCLNRWVHTRGLRAFSEGIMEKVMKRLKPAVFWNPVLGSGIDDVVDELLVKRDREGEAVCIFNDVVLRAGSLATRKQLIDRYWKRPEPPLEPAESSVVVCVSCVGSDGPGPVHIFSSMEKAKAYCAHDDRDHVIYDYVIDFPERHENLIQ